MTDPHDPSSPPSDDALDRLVGAALSSRPGHDALNRSPVAHFRARLRRRRTLRRVAAGITSVVAVAGGAWWVTHQPEVTTPLVRSEPATTVTTLPVSYNTVWHTTDDGIRLTDDNRPVRQFTRHSIEQWSYFDPEFGGQVIIQVPAREVMLIQLQAR